ncbi:MAG: UDP-3-O-(3-hydroxymyristoyl)glucosamine N-acyltransferase, partial [Phycisphaerae bacterium]
ARRYPANELAAVTLHPGVVLGADGFGFATTKEGEHLKVPQLGTVIVEDDVEIGANTCIDRGKVGPTRIGRGTKIDNLVQIAHNVRIGPNVIVVSLTGISGSAKIGAGVILAGQAGISDGVSIGEGAIVAGNAVVAHDIGANARVWGAPARDFTEAMRDLARIRKLPKLIARVAQLEKRLGELESADPPTSKP